MKLVDEKDDVLGAADLVHHRLDALLELAAVLRARDHQRQVESDDLLVAKNLRHLAGDDFLGQALGDGRLADAGLADQNRIVLGPAAKDLDDAFDLVGPPDHGIQFVLPGEFGQVAPERPQCRRLRILLSSCLGGNPFALLLRGEIWIELLEDFVSGALDVDLEAFQDARGDSFSLAQADREEYAPCPHRNAASALASFPARARTFFTRGV